MTASVRLPGSQRGRFDWTPQALQELWEARHRVAAMEALAQQDIEAAKRELRRLECQSSPDRASIIEG